MSTYSARISERMERANTLREARNQRYAYNAYLKQKEEEEKAETIARLQAEEEAKRRQNAGFFERFFGNFHKAVFIFCIIKNRIVAKTERFHTF